MREQPSTAQASNSFPSAPSSLMKHGYLEDVTHGVLGTRIERQWKWCSVHSMGYNPTHDTKSCLKTNGECPLCVRDRAKKSP